MVNLTASNREDHGEGLILHLPLVVDRGSFSGGFLYPGAVGSQ